MSPLSPSRYYARVFTLVTAAVLAYLLVRILAPFAVPLMWASVLAFMLFPLNQRLTRRLKRPGLSAGLLTFATFIVVVGPITLFAITFVRQAGELLARFQVEAHDRKLPALQLILELAPVQAVLRAAGEVTSLSTEEILGSATEAAQGALQQIASLGSTVVVGTVAVVTQFALTLFLLFFFLRDGQRMLERGIRLIPMAPARKEDLANTLGGVTRAVVLGTLVTALVQGTLVGIGFAIAGLPSPLVFGSVGAMASLIPIVGTALVWVPAAITLVAQGQTGWAVFLTLWSIVLVAGSDNVVRPLIISGNSKAPALLVFVCLLGGIGVFGFAGIFMGPLVLTLAATLLEYADSELPRLAGTVSQPPEPDSLLSVVKPESKPPVTEPEVKQEAPGPQPETRVDK